MPEWKEYTGRDDEHSEMSNAAWWICRYEDNTESGILSKKDVGVSGYIDKNDNIFAITHYLICEPHPLADMVIRQVQTGQIANYRHKVIPEDRGVIENIAAHYDSNYEYSFTPFTD